jgi:hypothetical protein
MQRLAANHLFPAATGDDFFDSLIDCEMVFDHTELTRPARPVRFSPAGERIPLLHIVGGIKIAFPGEIGCILWGGGWGPSSDP